MELRKPAVNAVSDSRKSPVPTHRHHLSFASDILTSASATPDLQIKTQPRGQIGVLTGLTSQYYLVRIQANWVPILKGNLLHSDSTPVDPHIDFKLLKLQKVRVLDPSSYTTLGILQDGDSPDTCRYPGNCETERVGTPDFEERPNQGLVEHYEELATRLMTDVVALSRLAEDGGQGINDFMSHEKGKIEKRVQRVVGELESLNTSESQHVKQVFLNLLHNLQERAPATCESCHAARYDIRLSCGHKYCNACQHKLVQKIMSGSMVRCTLCRMDLSKIDQRLVALELYYHRPRANSGAETARRQRHGRTVSQDCENGRCMVCHRTVPGSQSYLCCQACQSLRKSTNRRY